MDTSSRWLMIGALALCAPAAYSQIDAGLPAGEIVLSDDTLHLRYLTGSRKAGVDRGQLAGGLFIAEERDIVVTAGLLVPTDVELGPVSLAIGPRFYAGLLEEENDDVLSFALGAAVRFDLARDKGLAVTGEAYYGPDILTFGSANRLTDLSARVELRVTPRLIAFGGMRWFEFELTEPDSTGNDERTLQEELIAGVRWRF